MDIKDSVVPADAFCENCGHFAGKHFGLRCHLPAPDGVPPCRCRGLVWQGRMYKTDVDGKVLHEVPSRFVHLKGFWMPLSWLRNCDSGLHTWTGGENNHCSVCGDPRNAHPISTENETPAEVGK